MKVIIIGGSHAGLAACRLLKRLDESIEILLIERTSVLGFIPSSINLIFKNYFSEEEIDQGEAGDQATLESSGIQVFLNTTVTKIMAPEKKICYEDNLTKLRTVIHYDYLILATGSAHFAPLLPESNRDLNSIITYKKKSQILDAYHQLKNSQKIAIIGAGLIGLELANSLAKDPSKEIIIVERMSRPLFRYFDQEITDELIRHLPENVDLRLRENFNDYQVIEENGKQKLKLQFFNDTTTTVDACVFAVNPKPEVELLRGVVDLDFDDTVLVNEYMQTSIPEIYALGDLVRIPFGPNLDKAYLPLISNARKTALVAASHIAAATPLKMQPSQRTIGSKVFGVYLGSSGLTEEEAFLYDIETSTVTKTYDFYSKYHLPKEFFLTIKAIYRKDNRQLLGAQLITSRQDVLDYISALAQVIVDQKTVDSLVFSELFYSPDLSPSMNFLADLGLESLVNN
ncbi:FAD-dependent oxidoreductase [Enterococcus asini]|uniref:FAD-dependent oxidoreductase n=1 Tax=Enterococcus asini TaxID=57732 RepID=UPI0028928A11|nr:FAD-dependent oxidoreductase [Enterococcus asini]MDT2756353.1 FAD-dependent oxidoreductase [Enterococcus asini]